MPWLKVWDNITLGIDTRRKFARRRPCSRCGTCSLPDMADVLPHTLSGGQMQRVSLARALVRQPNLLLLDEPFGALDALTRWDMQDLLLRLRNEHGFATIMVTHDIGEALRLSDRVLVLRNGTIREELRIDRTEVDTDNRPSDFAALDVDCTTRFTNNTVCACACLRRDSMGLDGWGVSEAPLRSVLPA